MNENTLKWLDVALKPIEEFMNDPKVVEISCNSPGVVYIEKLGDPHMVRHEISELTSSEIDNLGQRAAAATEQFVNNQHPLLSAALPGGERLQVVIPPAASDGGAFSIRKQVVNDLSLDDYQSNGAFNNISVAVDGLSELDIELIKLLEKKDFYKFITTAIVGRVSILISGGTSSGKTTFLNACLKSVHVDERILTLEDTRELKPPQHNCVHLLASKGGQGTADVTMQDLLEASLRMRPDRLFVGEIRGSEAFSFLRAINTGHPGSMSTVHADTPDGAYEQLAMMMAQSGITSGYSKIDLMDYIKKVIPIVIQLRRDGGIRGVSEIAFNKVS